MKSARDPKMQHGLQISYHTDKRVFTPREGSPHRSLTTAIGLDPRFSSRRESKINKDIRNWNGKKIEAHYLGLENCEGTRISLIALDEPVITWLPKKGKSPNWVTQSIDPHPDEILYDGFVLSYWNTCDPINTMASSDSRRMIYQVHDIRRFPYSPTICLDMQIFRSVKVGETIGSWIDEDPVMTLGFDKTLYQLGFKPDADSLYNCVTNYGAKGKKLSIPLRYITLREWERPELQDIVGLKDTPEHSWCDVVLGYIGQRLRGIETAPQVEAKKGGTPQPRRDSEPREKLEPQPCYKGNNPEVDLWNFRIGRYKIFAVKTTAGVVYLTDSDWRDKETAILFFATLTDAKDYAKGIRQNPIAWFGKLIHDKDNQWESVLFDRILKAKASNNITLSDKAEEVEAEIQ